MLVGGWLPEATHGDEAPIGQDLSDDVKAHKSRQVGTRVAVGVPIAEHVLQRIVAQIVQDAVRAAQGKYGKVHGAQQQELSLSS